MQILEPGPVPFHQLLSFFALEVELCKLRRKRGWIHGIGLKFPQEASSFVMSHESQLVDLSKGLLIGSRPR